VPHPTDPLSQVVDDHGTALAFMHRYAEDDSDPELAERWRRLAASFNYLHFAWPEGEDPQNPAS
jgi:hypothetical protein